MREHGEPARDCAGEVVPRRLAKIFDFAKAVGEADLESQRDSNLGKAKGVKMGQANWEAKRACPGLICVEPHYELYDWLKEVRALTVRGINLEAEGAPVQLDMFHDWEKREERKALDDAIDEIRRRFGYRSIYAASLAGDLRMAQDRCETVAMPELMYM